MSVPHISPGGLVNRHRVLFPVFPPRQLHLSVLTFSLLMGGPPSHWLPAPPHMFLYITKICLKCIEFPSSSLLPSLRIPLRTTEDAAKEEINQAASHPVTAEMSQFRLNLLGWGGGGGR